MFIVDFDYTLYQTDLFVQRLKEVFMRYGVDMNTYRASYQQAVAWDGEGYGFDYSFEKHIHILQRMGYTINAAEVVPQLQACLKRDYICSDAIQFLQFLRARDETVLLSAGDVRFQKWKVETTGLNAYVDRCEYLSGNKDKFVAEVLKDGKQVIFINDNSKENASIKKKFPDVMVVGKKNIFKYDEQEVRASGVPYFETLTEIQTYVAKQLA